MTADDSYLIEYKERIDAGEIIAGRELRKELKNLVEDLKNDEYYYDRKDALLRIDFIENCIRLTKSPFYGKPMELMLWQKAFIETLYSFKMRRESNERGKVIDRFKKALHFQSKSCMINVYITKTAQKMQGFDVKKECTT
jgi:phage terminase large subunit-like protein